MKPKQNLMKLYKSNLRRKFHLLKFSKMICSVKRCLQQGRAGLREMEFARKAVGYFDSMARSRTSRFGNGRAVDLGHSYQHVRGEFQSQTVPVPLHVQALVYVQTVSGRFAFRWLCIKNNEHDVSIMHIGLIAHLMMNGK